MFFYLNADNAPFTTNARETAENDVSGCENKPRIPHRGRADVKTKRPGEFTVEEMREAVEAIDWPPRHQPVKWPKPPPGHMVYFVGSEHGPVKIGFTQQPIKERLKCIQNGSPVKLHVLALQPAPRQRESFYHRRFAAHRLHGEWFERVPEIEAEIARLTPTIQEQTSWK